jgi:hypothetical protein
MSTKKSINPAFHSITGRLEDKIGKGTGNRREFPLALRDGEFPFRAARM